MKKANLNLALSILFVLAGINSSLAQTDKPYTEGPLWQVQFIHTKPGMTELYLKNLSEGWIKNMKAAKDAGLVIDYKVLSSPIASENDWDLMLLYEVKNYAALDGMKEKMEAISKKVSGENEETLHKDAVSRNDLRTLQGGKFALQLDFK
jgi:hypothetical protein